MPVPVTAGILTLNNEMADSTSSEGAVALERFHTFESIRSDSLSILFIDAEYFEGEESVQFFLSRIRKKLQGIPVILIMPQSSIELVNTDWFFDDFIFYPYRSGELRLRIRKLLKKHSQSSDENTLSIGRITIDISNYSVALDDEKLDFTYKEFELLRLFAQNRGTVFSRKELLTTIWGVEYIGGTRTVDVHIRRLRSKLGDEFNSIIETVRNVGYRCRE
jgi:DNA-binding response OmpR family regulator